MVGEVSADETPELGWRFQRLPRAAVLAARDARLPATLLGDFLEALAESVSSGGRLGRDRLAGYAQLGRAAAEAGAPLAAVVDLYLSATWRAWPGLSDPARSGAAVREQALSVLRAADDAVASLCSGYASAQAAAARAEEALRRELVDDVLTGTSDVGQLLYRASALGLQLAAPHVVLVAKGERPYEEGRPLVRGVEAAVRDHVRTRPAAYGLTAAGALVTTRLGLLVCVVPVAAPGEAVDAVSAVVQARLAAGPRWRLAVAGVRAGAAGVRTGFDEGRRALEVADQLGWEHPVVDARDVLVHQVLVRDTAPMSELIRTTLAPLRTARGGGEPLLETLSAYFAAGAVATVAARALHLSVRALTYRLDRVRRLTGLDPTDPDDRYTLQTAVLGWRLLGWPGEQGPGAGKGR